MRESEVPCLIIVGPTPHKVFLIASAKQLLPFFHSFFLSLSLPFHDVDDDGVVQGVGRRAGVDPCVGGRHVDDVQRGHGHHAGDRICSCCC